MFSLYPSIFLTCSPLFTSASRPDNLSGREATSGVTNKHIPVLFIVHPDHVSEVEHHNDVQLSTRSLLSLLDHHLLQRLLRRVFHIAGCL